MQRKNDWLSPLLAFGTVFLIGAIEKTNAATKRLKRLYWLLTVSVFVNTLLSAAILLMLWSAKR